MASMRSHQGRNDDAKTGDHCTRRSLAGSDARFGPPRHLPHLLRRGGCIDEDGLPMIARETPTRPIARWLLERGVEDVDVPESKSGRGEQQPWWRVVCLTGVD